MIDDPDYWRERARNDAEQASDPEQRRLWRHPPVIAKLTFVHDRIHGQAGRVSRRAKNRGPLQAVPVMARAIADRLG
jgi:hypothetical protein